MRLTQKEWQIVEAFIRGKDITVVSFLPYQKEVIDYVQDYKNFLPSRGGKRLRLSGLLERQLGDAFFEPLPDEELKLWNCEEVEDD